MAPPEQVLHVYRHLLRATTYVPDSFARGYIHNFVVSRFKANCTPANLFRPNAKATATNRIKKARHWTRILENASRGDIVDLQKVLLQVHGRQGPRKRVLLRQFLQTEEATLPKDDSALEELIHKPLKDSTLKLERGTRLHALCKSQTEENHPLHLTSKLRHLEPKFPKENIWGRPTPRKLAANLTNKWWADTIDKILPPVPRSEEQRLRDLASGAVPLDEFPPRRAKGTISASLMAEEKQMNGEQLLKVLRTSARTNKHGVPKLEFDAANGLVVGDAEETVEKPISHTHARSMRRLYSTISQLVPSIAQDEVTKKWVVQWGAQKSKALNGEVSKPSKQHMELFEGLDGSEDSGKPLPVRHARAIRKKLKSEMHGEVRQEEKQTL